MWKSVLALACGIVWSICMRKEKKWLYILYGHVKNKTSSEEVVS